MLFVFLLKIWLLYFFLVFLSFIFNKKYMNNFINCIPSRRLLVSLLFILYFCSFSSISFGSENSNKDDIYNKLFRLNEFCVNGTANNCDPCVSLCKFEFSTSDFLSEGKSVSLSSSGREKVNLINCFRNRGFIFKIGLRGLSASLLRYIFSELGDYDFWLNAVCELCIDGFSICEDSEIKKIIDDEVQVHEAVYCMCKVVGNSNVLEGLYFNYLISVDEYFVKSLACAIGRNKTIKSLSFVNFISREGHNDLITIIKEASPLIECLNFSKNSDLYFDDAFFKLLLEKFKNLKHIDFSCCEIASSEGSLLFCEYIKNNKIPLEVLKCEMFFTSDRVVSKMFFEALKCNTILKCVDFSSNFRMRSCLDKVEPVVDESDKNILKIIYCDIHGKKVEKIISREDIIRIQEPYSGI